MDKILALFDLKTIKGKSNSLLSTNERAAFVAIMLEFEFMPLGKIGEFMCKERTLVYNCVKLHENELFCWYLKPKRFTKYLLRYLTIREQIINDLNYTSKKPL